MIPSVNAVKVLESRAKLRLGTHLEPDDVEIT